MSNIKCDWIVCKYNNYFRTNREEKNCMHEGEIRLRSANKFDLIDQNIISDRFEKFIDNENCGFVMMCDNYKDIGEE